MPIRSSRGRVLIATVALGLACLLVTPAGASTHGAQLWVSRFSGPGEDTADSVATSPDGHQVYVTGRSAVEDPQLSDAVTIAYDAITGTELWTARYYAPDHGMPEGQSIGISVLADPTGSVVYAEIDYTDVAAGSSLTNRHLVVAAYRASTGEELWTIDRAGFFPWAMALSPDGTSLVLTGFDANGAITKSIDASDGHEMWSSSGDAGTSSVALTFVPGHDLIVETQVAFDVTDRANHFSAVGLVASSGAAAWSTEVATSALGSSIHVTSAPDGSAVFVASGDDTAGKGLDYLTTSLDPSSGAALWSARLNGHGKSNDQPFALVVNPAGTRVFITGTARSDYTTVAYQAHSGSELWRAGYDGAGNQDVAMAVGTAPGGGKVFVTGFSPGSDNEKEYATFAYSAASGAQLWVSLYRGPSEHLDQALALAVSPRGGRVFVTGGSYAPGKHSDYATVAYAA